MAAQQNWPAEHCSALKRMIEVEGMSAAIAAAAINEAFGTAYSRSATIGKAKRANIRMAVGKGGRKGPKGGPSTRKGRPRAATPQSHPVAVRLALRQRFPAVQPDARIDPLPPGTVALVDLADNGCKWPSGDPALFCNAPRLDGLPYCAGHFRLARR